MTLGNLQYGRPILVAPADGRLEIFAIDRTGRLVGKSQTSPGGPFGPGWRPVGGAGPAGCDLPRFDPRTTRIAHATDAAGWITLFARCTAGRVGYTYLVPGEGWSGWRSLPVGAGPGPGDPVATGRAGALPPVLVVGTATGDVSYGVRAGAADPDGWQHTRWITLAGAPTGPVGVGVGGAGPVGAPDVVLFGAGAGGDVWTRCGWLDAAPGVRFDPDWLPGLATRRPGARAGGRPIPVSAAAAVWRGANGSAWYATVTAPGVVADARDLHLRLAGDPATATSSGSTWIAGRTPAGQLWLRRRRSGRDWEELPCTHADRPPAAGDPALAIGADGRADLVYAGRDRRIHHLRQAADPASHTPGPTGHPDRAGWPPLAAAG